MSGSIKVVTDTNVYFMFFYDSASKAGKLIEYAIAGSTELFSPDTVREELKRVLVRELDFDEAQSEKLINYLPTRWVDKEIYQEFLTKAKIIKHMPDRPLMALAIALNCGIITANIKDFKPAAKLVKIWKIDELLEVLNNLRKAKLS